MKEEAELYEQATTNINERARYQLANYMAHGYQIEHVQPAIVLSREDKTEKEECLILMPDGILYVGLFTMQRRSEQDPFALV